MNRFLAAVVTLPMLVVHGAAADDIEAYLPDGGLPGVYVNIVMDLGDTSIDTPLCTYGVDCAPPFTSDATHRHLGDMYVEGEPVTSPGMFRAVLSTVLEHPHFSAISFSLSIANHAGNTSIAWPGKTGGATILQGCRRLAQGRQDLIATLKAIPQVSGATSHAWQARGVYFEWSRYLGGGAVGLGRNTSGNFGLNEPLPNFAADIISGDRYQSPLVDLQGCEQLYSILFTLGTPALDTAMDDEITAQMGLPRGSTLTQMLAYLHASDTDLAPQVQAEVHLDKSWVISSRSRAGNASAYATAAGSVAPMYVDDPVQLELSLTRALASTTVLPSGGATAAFAVDSFQPGRALDALYLPLFQPLKTINWKGNLKKFRLISSQPATDSSHFETVVDARGMPALDTDGDSAGQIRFTALSMWTDVATLPPGDGQQLPQGVDGNIVARGGAGQKVDGYAGYGNAPGQGAPYFIGDSNADTAQAGYTPRQLFFAAGSAAVLHPFNADQASIEILRPLLDPEGEMDEAALLELVRWARGQDTRNNKASARDWLLGGIIHSQPLALNYGATAGYSRTNPNVRLLFGSAEGAFHILQDTDTSGRESGREVFAFYPSETLANLKLQYEDETPASQMRYGVDGSAVALKVDRNGDGTLDHAAGDLAYVFFGLRRGGASYYAFDVSDPASMPSLQWKISPTVGGSFSELGLTFSTPVVGRVNYNGMPVDVLVFGGGYDGGWNQDYSLRRGKDAGAGDDAAGNALYIVDARTGELIWKAVRGNTGGRSNTHYQHAGLVDSIPSPVAVLTNADGIVHRIYVGDTGGAVWRVDVPPSVDGDENHRRDNWFVTKLADLGADRLEPGGSPQADRRFFHAPDTVRSFDDLGPFDGVIIASGNRADPNETLVANHLFYLKDRETDSGSAAVRARNDASDPRAPFQFSDLPDQTSCTSGNEEVIDASSTVACADRDLANGWKIAFTKPGEKGMSRPLTDGGRIFAATFIPGAATACAVRQGHGQLHVVKLLDGTAAANQTRVHDVGPGIPAPPLSVSDIIFLPGSGIELTGTTDDSEPESTRLLPSEAGKLYRVYWREPGTDPL